jgi:FkbM family methyltransferase
MIPSQRIFRRVYLQLFKPTYWSDNDASLRRFYSQFIKKGFLVFDVGANFGEYSEAFLSLGARVIAVEPQPTMVDQLKRIPKLTVVPCAVGEKSGNANLHLTTMHQVASLVPNWIDSVTEIDPLGERPLRLGTLQVEVQTLDTLIDRFGMPNYIKIDVEGYELSALRGLSRTPDLLSFEFNAARMEMAIACMERFPNCLFNYIAGEPRRGTNLALPDFVGLDEMKRLAKAKFQRFGDVFVFNQRIS